MSHLRKSISVLAGIYLFGASIAIAQSSFDQGSFGTDEEGGVQQQSPAIVPPAAAPAADSFGGSFGDGGGTPTAGGGGDFQGGSFAPDPASNPGPTPAVQIPGGADFPGGSFDNDQGGVTPTPPQQGVVNPPVIANPGPSVTPQPQPQPGPVIDPQVTALETRDFGVPPTNLLRNGQFHSPTPTSIPGGQIVTTQQLVNAINGNTQMVVIDVLGGQYALPNAFSAPAMSQGGGYNDHIQQQTVQWLGQVTGGNRQMPLVIYCSDPMCWLSYNASLRAIAAGYTNVYWYRGGLAVWQQAGLPLQPGSY